jgi:hypothetical protein
MTRTMAIAMANAGKRAADDVSCTDPVTGVSRKKGRISIATPEELALYKTSLENLIKFGGQYRAEAAFIGGLRETMGKRQGHARRHCTHCSGLSDTCSCYSGCQKPEKSKCKPRPVGDHCKHCQGHSSPCSCEDECAKPAESKCYPRHCKHCKGKEGSPCACTELCGKPAGTKCLERPERHCTHCSGLATGCGCKKECSRPEGAKCHPAHCVHCSGNDGVCYCLYAKCERPAGALCHPPHCDHCGGGKGLCACKKCCARPSHAKCWV